MKQKSTRRKPATVHIDVAHAELEKSQLEAAECKAKLEAAETALQEANSRLRVASESNDLACSKLEAAEALSGLLRDQLQHEQEVVEDARKLARGWRNGQGTSPEMDALADRILASRPSEQAQPTPPTRLGGQADALRSEILAALQRVQARGVLAIGQQSMAFCEALVEELGVPEQAPQGAPPCKWCGKNLCDCPRPQGAPRPFIDPDATVTEAERGKRS